MNALLDSLGVIDTSGKNHCVKLKSGLNIITGKSSTGKSALINIFDYCMGCTRNNIPHGIISNNAALFYIVLKKDDGALILARKNAKTSNSFLKPVSSIPNSDELTLEYFSEDYFITNESFKEILGRVH